MLINIIIHRNKNKYVFSFFNFKDLHINKTLPEACERKRLNKDLSLIAFILVQDTYYHQELVNYVTKNEILSLQNKSTHFFKKLIQQTPHINIKLYQRYMNFYKRSIVNEVKKCIINAMTELLETFRIKLLESCFQKLEAQLVEGKTEGKAEGTTEGKTFLFVPFISYI